MRTVFILDTPGSMAHLLVAPANRAAEALRVESTFVTVQPEGLATVMSNGDLLLIAPETQQESAITQLLSHENVRLIPNDIYGWLNGESLVKWTNQIAEQDLALA